MDIKQYLQRIRYVGPVNISREVLTKLQKMHLLTVPFENLDIHNNTPVDLKDLFNKIVSLKRGGFCYELNGSFYQLLKEIGFTVKMVSARVYNGKDYSPEFDHMALVVTLDDAEYLTDVGFGEFSLHPIKIEPGKDIVDPAGIFRIEAFDEVYKVVTKKNPDGEFVPEYIFSGKPRKLEEFHDMCIYHQTNPGSHFMQNRVCSIPTKNGRITLTGNKLKITENGKVSERQLNNEEEVQSELWNYFQVKL